VTTILIAAGVAVLALVALALILPCEGCRLRRKRIEDAYQRWRSSR